MNSTFIFLCSSTEVLHGYSGQTVTLEFPEGTSVYDVRWIAIYCTVAEVNFGNVVIPEEFYVPPILPPAPSVSILLYKLCTIMIDCIITNCILY